MTEPIGLCLCGCGELTNRDRRGRRQRFLPNHYQRTLKGRHAGYRVEDHGHDTPCWIWQGGRGGAKASYGRMSVDGRNMPAHRHYYEQAKGPVAEGLQLDHLCRGLSERIAERHGVRKGAIRAITKGATWRDVQPLDEREVVGGETFGRRPAA